MTTRVEFIKFPPEPLRLAWCDWLRHHTINPGDVAVPGWIETDADAYRISYLSFDLDDNGHIRINPDTDDVIRVVRTVQLEARPSPFPEQCATSP